jgi:hypothetical protein
VNGYDLHFRSHLYVGMAQQSNDTFKSNVKLIYIYIHTYTYIYEPGAQPRDVSSPVRLYFVWFVCFWRDSPPPPNGSGPPQSRGFYITHNDAPLSVGLLWTSDQPVTETSIWQHTTLTTNIHAHGGIPNHNLSRRAAADHRLKPRGHCTDRHTLYGGVQFFRINTAGFPLTYKNMNQFART